MRAAYHHHNSKGKHIEFGGGEEQHYNINNYNLIVDIRHAEGIDNPSNYPNVTGRYYRAVFWVEEGQEYWTHERVGLPNPVWNEKVLVELDKHLHKDDNYNMFLHVEVLRFDSTSDPGTSTGVALVGRARIPLPTLVISGEEKRSRGGRFGLVRLQGAGCKAEGHIILSMESKRKKKRLYCFN